MYDQLEASAPPLTPVLVEMYWKPLSSWQRAVCLVDALEQSSLLSTSQHEWREGPPLYCVFIFFQSFHFIIGSVRGVCWSSPPPPCLPPPVWTVSNWANCLFCFLSKFCSLLLSSYETAHMKSFCGLLTCRLSPGSKTSASLSSLFFPFIYFF